MNVFLRLCESMFFSALGVAPWRVKGEFCLQGYLQGYLCEKKNVFFLLVGLRGSAEEFRVDGLGIIRSSWIPRRALCVFCLQGYV